MLRAYCSLDRACFLHYTLRSGWHLSIAGYLCSKSLLPCPFSLHHPHPLVSGTDRILTLLLFVVTLSLLNYKIFRLSFTFFFSFCFLHFSS